MVTSKENFNEAEELQHITSEGKFLSPKNDEILEDPLGYKQKGINMQIIMSILVSIPNLSIGMTYGFPAVALPILSNQTNPLALNDEQASWFASLNILSSLFGAIICSYILDSLGRITTLYIVKVLAIISWIVMITASDVNKDYMYIQMLIARSLMGISAGISTTPSSVYVSEISNPNLRGRLCLLTVLTIALGFLIIYTLGFLIPENWRIISGICCGISVLSLIVITFIPESPNWLALKGRSEAAERSFRLFKGLPRNGCIMNSKIQEELDSLLQHSAMKNNRKSNNVINLLRQQDFYKPFIIMLGLTICQQFCGVHVVMVYAIKFSSAAGVNIDPYMCAVLIGVIRVLGTMSLFFVVDKIGRRKALIYAGVLMSACLLGTAACIYYPMNNLIWLPIVLLLVLIFAGTFGMLTIPMLLLGEIYPQKIRGFASSLTSTYMVILFFVSVKIYPTLLNSIGNVNVLIFYGVISLLGSIYVYFLLPETNGRSLQEIENSFKSKKAPK